MADTYALTVLQEARRKLSDAANKKFEMRPEITKIKPVFDSGRKWIPVGDLANLRESETRPTSIMYFQNADYTPATHKSCTPVGEVGATSKVALTWNQLVIPIKLQYKQHNGNEYKAAEVLQSLLWNLEKSMFLNPNTSLDAVLYAYLEANRTQVNAISAGGSFNTWNAANFRVDVMQANKNRFYNFATPDMAMNNYSAPIWDVCNTSWLADYAHISNQGPNNSTNFSYQFSGYNVQNSNLVMPAGYYEAMHYLIPDGGVAIVFWNDKVNRDGKKSGNSTWGTFQSMMYPDVTYDLFTVDGCADTTADGGGRQDYVITYEFTITYAIAMQPLSTSPETPIFGYGILL